MKTLLLLAIQFAALCGPVFSQQCPQSVLKIQSPICDTPKNLRVNINNCTTANLRWQGSKEQQYVVNATGTDADANTLFEVKEARYSCNENGNCAATIAVQEGAMLNWTVQAVCGIDGAIIYSPEVQAKQTIIPYCNAVADDQKISNDNSNNPTIRVYPNPTTGYLTVEYKSSVVAKIKLSVIDMTGKTVFNKPGKAVAGSNRYKLDLHNLVPGVYMLVVNGGNNVDHIKFIVQSN